MTQILCQTLSRGWTTEEAECTEASSGSWRFCSSTTEALLPPWLAPEQIRILAVTAVNAEYADTVAAALTAVGLRARVDRRIEMVGRRIADSRHAAVPFVAVVGEREGRDHTVAVRARNARHDWPLQQAVDQLRRLCRSPLRE